MDIKNLANGEGGGGGLVVMSSIQKNEKITRIVPILKSNST